MRGWVIGLVGTVLLVVALAIAAVVAVSSAGGGTALVDLEPGDCFELPDSLAAGAIESVQPIDCDEPHLAEVVAVGELGADGLDYPADEMLFDDVDRSCRLASPVMSDEFGLLPVASTRDLWESFDGRFVCIAVPFGGAPVTGSALGS